MRPALCSRSAFNVWQQHVPSARARSDSKLGEAIVEIHRSSRRTYGAPRITAALRRLGIRVGRKRVARLMVRQGLAGRARRRWARTTIPDPTARVASLDRPGRAFAPGSCALDRISVSDITSERTHEGSLYLATTLDLASRRVVGFAMADHMRASLVCDALTMALERRRPAPGFVVHSDRGSQGGFHRSSQHLGTEVVRDGCWQAAAGDPCDARPDVVAWQAIDGAA